MEIVLLVARTDILTMLHSRRLFLSNICKQIVNIGSLPFSSAQAAEVSCSLLSYAKQLKINAEHPLLPKYLLDRPAIVSDPIFTIHSSLQCILLVADIRNVTVATGLIESSSQS